MRLGSSLVWGPIGAVPGQEHRHPRRPPHDGVVSHPGVRGARQRRRDACAHVQMAQPVPDLYAVVARGVIAGEDAAQVLASLST